MVNRLYIVALAVCVLAGGCSTTLVREEPHEIRLGEADVRYSVSPLAEALLAIRGTSMRSLQGSWKDRVFAAECVTKGEPGRFTAIFLAPHMRLATLAVTPPHTLTFDRAREVPDAFEPEYAIFDLAVVNLDTEVLRRSLGNAFAVVEHGGRRTVSAGGSPVAVRTLLPDGSVLYENIFLGYVYTLKETK